MWRKSMDRDRRSDFQPLSTHQTEIRALRATEQGRSCCTMTDIPTSTWGCGSPTTASFTPKVRARQGHLTRGKREEGTCPSTQKLCQVVCIPHDASTNTATQDTKTLPSRVNSSSEAMDMTSPLTQEVTRNVSQPWRRASQPRDRMLRRTGIFTNPLARSQKETQLGSEEASAKTDGTSVRSCHTPNCALRKRSDCTNDSSLKFREEVTDKFITTARIIRMMLPNTPLLKSPSKQSLDVR